jgi:hypothetical protein
MPTTMLLGATYFSEELTVKDFRLVEIEWELGPTGLAPCTEMREQPSPAYHPDVAQARRQRVSPTGATRGDGVRRVFNDQLRWF